MWNLRGRAYQFNIDSKFLLISIFLGRKFLEEDNLVFLGFSRSCYPTVV